MDSFDDFLNQMSTAASGIGQTVTDIWGTAREIGATVNPPPPQMTPQQVAYQNQITASATSTRNSGNLVGLGLLALGFWIIKKAL